MTQLKGVAVEERVRAWGYDPLAGLKYIGDTEKSFDYRHPDGNTHSGKFTFSYNQESGSIDVRHLGCNGCIFTGRELPDGTVTFSPPKGYPSAETFSEEFKILRDKFLEDQRV